MLKRLQLTKASRSSSFLKSVHGIGGDVVPRHGIFVGFSGIFDCGSDVEKGLVYIKNGKAQTGSTNILTCRYLLLLSSVANMGLEDIFTKACIDRKIPGAVLIADGDNGFHYEKAFGTFSLDPNSSPLTTDAVFWLASCTKLMTTVGVMHAVERGLFTLDEDVCRFLPELKDIEILTSFDDAGKPVLVKNTKTITLRHLLTHTSGLSYDTFSPALRKYSKAVSRPLSNSRTGTIPTTTLYPLLFPPSTSWDYGVGIDWAGLLLSRASGIPLRDYLTKNIFTPLGMTSATFRPYDTPDIRNRVMDMSTRDGPIDPLFGTTLAPDADVIPAKGKKPADVRVTDDYGGAGCFCSAADYAKLLRSLASPSAPVQILQPSSIAEMFTPQLSASAKSRLQEILRFKEVNNSMGGVPRTGHQGMEMDCGVGGQIVCKDVPGRRRGGSLFWGGLPNLVWWVDRVEGVSGIFATQILPPGDPKCVELQGVFEEEVYRLVGEGKGKGGGRARL